MPESEFVREMLLFYCYFMTYLFLDIRRYREWVFVLDGEASKLTESERATRFEWSSAVLEKIHDELFECSKVFVCLNKEGVHWALAIIYPFEYKMEIIDNMVYAVWSYWDSLLDDLKLGFMRALHGYGFSRLDIEKEFEITVVLDRPKQGAYNGNDCGYFMATFIDHAFRGLPFSFKRCDIYETEDCIGSWEGGSSYINIFGTQRSISPPKAFEPGSNISPFSVTSMPTILEVMSVRTIWPYS